ncbi:MAG TPA: DUF1499 domain-containing protein [Burkholderiaceae bacterium]|nr:DUF1499 domain-containing protein [Burkholderiaceae bacterium]
MKLRRVAMHFVIWLALAVVAVLLAARFGAFAGRMPDNLGVRDGKLKPPSRTPNSVSSQADLWPDAPQRDYARIAPLPLSGDAKATIARIAALVEDLPGARIVERREDYLYVQFTTALMRYVDDVEFWVDPAAGVVQVRSASRLGSKDFGVNRARVELIRARLAAAGA